MSRIVVRWGAPLVLTAALLAACTSSTQSNREAVDGDTTAAQTQCILERVERDFGLAISNLGGDLSPEQELTVAIARDICLLDPDADSSRAEPSRTGDTLPPTLANAPQSFDPDDMPPGDDEALDQLWIACGEGDPFACDELLLSATPATDYEAFAFSCGGRENLRCSTLLGEAELTGALTPQTPPPGEQQELDRWWLSCADGSALACDQLFLTAPSGSAYYQFGNTCGGRASGYCTELLGDDGRPPILEHLAPTDAAPGTDDLLDQLWAACANQAPNACRDLYSVAPYGSIYERFAISCGGLAVKPCEALFLDEQADRIEDLQDSTTRSTPKQGS